MKVIKIQTPVINLGQFLKYVGIVENGSLAKEFLATHSVFVDGLKEIRRGRKLFPGTVIQVDSAFFTLEGESNE